MKITTTTEDWGYEDWLENIKENGHLLRGVPEEFRTVELCLEAVKSCGVSLRYVPKEIRTVEICLAAIKKCGWGLEFTPEEIKTPELCREAVRFYALHLKHVPEIFLDLEKLATKKQYKLTENISKDLLNQLLLTDQELLAKYSIEELLTSRYNYLRDLAKRNIE